MKKILLLSFLLMTQAWANYPVVQTGGGGIPIWAATTSYTIDQHVNNADKLYRALASFTSGGAFVPANWQEVSDDLNRETAVTDTALVVWDGTGGDDVLDSVVTLDGAGVMAGVTELTGNITLNGDVDVLGTLTTSTQAALDITNAVISVNVGGNQATANANDAGLVVSITDATNSQMGYDSACPTYWQAGLVGSLDCVVTETIAQSLTNKELGNSASINADLYLDMVGVAKAARPFNIMTEVQRDALTPVQAGGVYNSNTDKLNIYNGTVWKAIGGGIDAWLTATVYTIGDVTHESNKIYLALTSHTSGTFATDLAANDWIELSDDLNRETSVTDNALPRWDGTGGDDVQDSLVIVSDLGAVTGITDLTITGDLGLGLTTNSVIFQGASTLSEDNTNFTWTDGSDTLNVTGAVTVDNFSLDGNTLASTDTNGNVVVSPDGTGQFSVLKYFLMPHLVDPVADPAAASSNLFFMADELLHDKDENGVVNPIADRNSNDILVNRSFEKSYGATAAGWTGLVGAATTATISGVANCAPGQGDQCSQIAPIAQTFTYTQNIDCDTSDGKLIGFSGWVKAGYQTEICSLKAGVVETCITAPDSDKWTKRTITMFAKSGDTCGVQVRSTVAVSGLATFDGFKTELDPIKSATKEVVEEYRTSDALGYGSTATLIPYFKVTPDRDTISTSGVIENSTTNGWSFTASKTVKINFDGAMGSTVGGYMGLSLNSSTLTTSILSHSNEQVVGLGYDNIGGVPLTYGADIIMVAGDVLRNHAHTAVTLGGGSSYTTISFTATSVEEVMATSTNSGLTPWTAYTPTTQGFGTLGTNQFQWKRVGDSYHILGTFLTGTTTASEAQISLPNGKAVKAGQLITLVGMTSINTGIARHLETLATGGDTFLNFGRRESGTSGLIARAGNELPNANGDQFSFHAIVPIEGLDSPATFPVYIPYGKTCHIYDEKANGVEGGGSTSGSWQTRDLNLLGDNCGFASLSANEFTLVAGTYDFDISIPFYSNADSLSVALYDTDTTTYEIYSNNSPASGSSASTMILKGQVTIAVATTFDVRYWATTGVASNGLGRIGPAAIPERYTQVAITKVK